MKYPLLYLCLLLLAYTGSNLFAQVPTTNTPLKSGKTLKPHRQAAVANSPEKRQTIRLRGRDVPVQQHIDHSPYKGSGKSLFPTTNSHSDGSLMGSFWHSAAATPANADYRIVSIDYDPKSSSPTPIYVRLTSDKPNAFVAPAKGVEGNYMDILEAQHCLLHIEKPKDEFRLIATETDDLGITHVKLQQIYEGVPLQGSQLFLHYTASNELVINGRYQATPQNISTLPYFTPETATNTALSHLAQQTVLRPLSDFERQILQYDQPDCQLVLSHLPNDPQQIPVLAYQLTIRPNFLERWVYFINAHNGAVLYHYNHTCSDGPSSATVTDLNGQPRNIPTYQVGSTYYMIDGSRPMFNGGMSDLPDNPVGAIWCINSNNTALDNVTHVTSSNNVWNSPKSASAMHNGGLAYEYFRNTHNRNSLNGQGGTIISVINVTEDDGTQMDNAFWNGQLMAYGNGNQLCDRPLAAGLDVAGHEMTHGVIENNGAGGLEYMGQSGALNESFADIFGCMIDRDDWLVGEDIINNAVIPSGALRSMSNPHNGASSPSTFYWQPENMSEYQNLSSNQDNGGVHINSGIPNKAFYLYATAVTKDKAERVYYRALTQYLTNNSQFIDCRIAVIQAATDIYGASSYEAQSARNAFDGVQIYGGTSGNNGTGGSGGTSSNDDYPPVNGTDYLYVYAPDEQKSYVVTTGTPVTFEELIDGQLINNASISDNGSIAFLVASDGNVYSTTLNTTNPQVEQWTTDNTWVNVAVSRDGTKLALVDNSTTGHTLYVYHITSGQLYSFNLYNPSYSGTSSGGVKYADALDWDFSGETVMYDAYNAINNTGGNDLDYWDINFIQVWDNATNQPANGEVQKLFSSLPEGISIGNAVFSKNSPYIIAFDVLDDNQNTFYLYGTNIINGDQSEILSSNTVAGVPSYSKNDNFITFTTVDGTGADMIAKIPLATDKITPNGSWSSIVTGGVWSVWYTVGTRPSTACVGFGVNITAQGATQICSGGSVTLDAGAGYTTYAWSGGGNTRYKTASTAGSYTVTVTQGTCSATSQPINVSLQTTPSASFSYQINASAVSFSNNSLNATNYSWNFGDGTTSTEPNPYHVYSSVGNKTVTLTASNNCFNNNSSQTFNISIVGIGNEAAQPDWQLRLLPNPVPQGQWQLSVARLTEVAQVTVFDLNGRMVFSDKIAPAQPAATLPIDMSYCAGGLYMVQVSTAQGTMSRKIVLE